MVVVVVGPDVAVGVVDKVAGVVLDLQRRVLAPPESDGEDEEHPGRVACELREAARNEATEEHYAMLSAWIWCLLSCMHSRRYKK